MARRGGDELDTIAQHYDRNVATDHDDIGAAPRPLLSDIFMTDRMGESRHELVTRLSDAGERERQLRDAVAVADASRDKYLAFYNHAPVGFLTLDDAGVVQDANPAAARLCGMPTQRLARRPFVQLLSPDERPLFESKFDQLRADRTSATLDVHLTGGDNAALLVHLEIDATYRSGGESPDFHMVMQDVTPARDADELIRKTFAEVSLLESKLKQEGRSLPRDIGQEHSHKDIVGNSEALRAVLEMVEQVAPTDSRALILGETGSGKELLAQAIHNLSARRDRPMITVNCAALPPTLIEGELFGREKGAYTGALSKQLGRFELAHRSTIFLDEIDSVPLDLQAKFLRVLECGQFERLGSPHAVKVDVRVIAASNRDLALAVQEGTFREDLYYRLNVFQIQVPPLRERREDIMPLVWSFIDYFGKRMGKRIESIPKQTALAMQTYPWPGNIRELKNMVERAMIISTGPQLHLDVPLVVRAASGSRTLDEMERDHIIDALATCGGRVSGTGGAAEILGINPKTLGSRMVKHGIKRNNT
ncbi:MAG: sigma 54-interacting transcriptional regulator [Nitrospinae bacterium]|nr:sigma 54-interacting transcriptional regulator [Nitrospinota bacterium]